MSALNRYTCEEAFRRLDDYLDRELDADEMTHVRQHLEICAGCAREFTFEESLLHGVRRKLQQIDVPKDLQSRVLSLLKEQK
jgi:anti-sigma factor (TIGR02949 family)